MKSRTTKSIFRRELHRDSLERPLLYMVLVGNDESYAHDFFKANERQRARDGLLMIPAERGSVRGGPRATNANGEGSYSRRRHHAVTEVAMAVRRAIGNMSIRPLASTRAT